MGNSKKLIQLDPDDNVMVARQEIIKGECINISGIEITSKVKVKLGFKVAAVKIEKGEPIIKCKAPIGSATAIIFPGEIVHLHNMKSDYSPTYTLEDQHGHKG